MLKRTNVLSFQSKKSNIDMPSYQKTNISFHISDVLKVHRTTFSYNGSISTITHSVSYHHLNDLNSRVPVEYVSDAQNQNSPSMYDLKNDNQLSSIRLSIIILGCLCIVLILLHAILSVITWNKIQLKPFFIQIEQRNNDFI